MKNLASRINYHPGFPTASMVRLFWSYRVMTSSLRRVGWITLCLVVGFVVAACQRPLTTSKPADPQEDATGPIWFEDVTDAVGLDFVQDPGPTNEYFMPQSMGSGCAFIHETDRKTGQDNLYIYLLNNAGPNSKSVNRLYRQTAQGRFQDITVGSGLDVAGNSIGVAVGDINNDGLPDVLLTQYGGIKLFLNQGGGRFLDVTEKAGLSNPLWGASAAFVDFDRDGWLDLIVVNYVDYDPKVICNSMRGSRDYCGPNRFPGTCSKLFHNLGRIPDPDGQPGADGSMVHFEDVSFATGIGRKPGPGLGVICADFDGDGWPSIFISNDGQPNHLWISHRKPDGQVFFTEEALARGVAVTTMAKAFAGMGIALGDVDNTGLLDLFVTHLGHETHTLWKQGPRGEFKDRTLEAGLMNTRWHGTGFGTLMADFNLDGALDLVIVNGAVLQGPSDHAPDLGFWGPYAERNQLLANDGHGRFRDLSPSNKAFCGCWNVARGLACTDFDGNGAPGLLVSSIGSRARLFRNVAPNRGHWLKVRTHDPRWQRDAYGAEVHVHVAGHDLLRLINPAESYLSSSSPFALFGLGNEERVDRIRVRWPDGPLDEEEEFAGGAVDRLVVLERGSGRVLKVEGRQP
jgi:enediyne biosynthesis protein E4